MISFIYPVYVPPEASKDLFALPLLSLSHDVDSDASKSYWMNYCQCSGWEVKHGVGL